MDMVMSFKERARLGGLKTRRKYGLKYMRRLGRIGGIKSAFLRKQKELSTEATIDKSN